MKVVLTKVPQDATVKAGTPIDRSPGELQILQDAGYEFVSAAEHAANERVQAAQAEAQNRVKIMAEQAVKDAVSRAKLREAIAAKDTEAEASALSRIAALDYKPEAVQLVVNQIESLKASEGHIAVQRLTTSTGDVRVEVGEQGFRDTVKEYMAASLPFVKQHRNGGIVRAAHQDPAALKQAIEYSRERSRIGAKLVDMVNRGADASVANLSNIVKAGDYADPAVGNPLGILNTGMLLHQNLGFLSAQLALLDDITSDVTSQPALFNQVVRSRYLTVPKVQLKTTSNAWSTAQTGTDVDVNVVMDSHPGVPIAINNNILSSTPRQLFNEQRQPMLYGLGQYIIAKLVQTIFNGSTRIANDGTTTSTVTFADANNFSFGGPVSLATFTADIPEKMDEMLIPGGDELPSDTELQRFLWVHGRVYAAAAGDPTLMQIQAIQALRGQSSNGNIVETGRYERLGNLKIRKSQLMVDNNTISGSGADATTNGITVTPGAYGTSTYVGIGGTRNALLFVSRVPQDYTKVLPDVPSTAAIELVTEPRTGITFLIVKYLDHAYEVANMRAQVMFGTAIGDERQAFKGTRA